MLLQLKSTTYSNALVYNFLSELCAKITLKFAQDDERLHDLDPLLSKNKQKLAKNLFIFGHERVKFTQPFIILCKLGYNFCT